LVISHKRRRGLKKKKNIKNKIKLSLAHTLSPKYMHQKNLDPFWRSLAASYQSTLKPRKTALKKPHLRSIAFSLFLFSFYTRNRPLTSLSFSFTPATQEKNTPKQTHHKTNRLPSPLSATYLLYQTDTMTLPSSLSSPDTSHPTTTPSPTPPPPAFKSTTSYSPKPAQTASTTTPN
jgi:hypothetical protein